MTAAPAYPHAARRIRPGLPGKPQIKLANMKSMRLRRAEAAHCSCRAWGAAPAGAWGTGALDIALSGPFVTTLDEHGCPRGRHRRDPIAAENGTLSSAMQTWLLI